MGFPTVGLMSGCFKITILGFLFLCNYITSSNDVAPGFDKYDYSQTGVAYSFQSLVDFIKKGKYKYDRKVQNLLHNVENVCDLKIKPRPMTLARHAFIVVDGPSAIAKRRFGTALARSIGAQLLIDPPRCIDHLKDYFMDSKEMRQLFYSVNYYTSALNISFNVRNRPVVLVGFWMEQTAKYIVRKYGKDLPPENSSLYDFPKDLLAPDFVIFQNCYMFETRLKFIRIKKRIGKVYRRFKYPEVIEVAKPTATYTGILNLKRVIREKLADKLNVHVIPINFNRIKADKLVDDVDDF